MKWIIYIFIIFSFGLFTNCNPARKLPKGEYLLTKNNVNIDTRNVSKSELYNYIKPKPNRKILGIGRFNYWLYSVGNKGKENTFRRWLKRIGEAPVLVDSSQIENSKKQLRLYLNGKGYFNSLISNEVIYRKHKAKVIYNIKTPVPYTIKRIDYFSQDSLLIDFVIKDSANCLIKKGKNYDVDVLESERDRISNHLKNLGYFRFSKEYVVYNIDSANLNAERKMSIEINIKPLVVSQTVFPDSSQRINHKRYRIENIYIYPDYNFISKDSVIHDTIQFTIKQRKLNKMPLTYYFLYNERLKYKPKTLTQAIYLKRGDFYNLRDLQDTYNSLAGLQNFKFININYQETQFALDSNMLDAKIRLTRQPKQSFTIETEGTNTGGDLGVAANFGYQNLNLFRGAEIFNLKLKLALELQKNFLNPSDDNIIKPYLPFNTMETGIETNIEIPKFLVPLPQEFFAQSNKPKTNINIGINYQRRVDFTRVISNISFGYKWKTLKEIVFLYNPVELSGININIKPDSRLLNLIQTLNNPYFTNSYSNHLTEAGRLTMIYNSQDLSKKTDFRFIRINLKAAGNVLYAVDKWILNKPLENEYYKFLNNRYAQFIKTDFDYRYYRVVNEENTIVYRGFAGIGIAYLNLPTLPFEESYFGGGANDIRAWQIRSLGPGSYSETETTSFFDKTGDIKIAANIEYRYPIYKMLKGAIFADFGNVWLKNENPKFPGGHFEFDRFFKEIAIGTGLGVRLDFSFFIIRVDAAIPLKDPSRPEGDRFVFLHNKLSDIIFNLGIGYPF